MASSRPDVVIGELPSREVYPQVIEDYRNRRDLGIGKYGRPLLTHNGRRALQDAYEEAVDLTMYLKQRVMEEDDYQRVFRRLVPALMFYAEGQEDKGEQAKLALNECFEEGEDE